MFWNVMFNLSFKDQHWERRRFEDSVGCINKIRECIFKLLLHQDNFSYMKSSHPLSFQFALSPSDFSSSDVPEEELEEATSRGVRIMYSFPWGQEPLETLWSRGDTELLQTHRGVRSKLQVSLLLLFRVSMWTWLDFMCVFCVCIQFLLYQAAFAEQSQRA